MMNKVNFQTGLKVRGKGGAMCKKFFVAIVLLNAIIFLSSTSLWATTATQTFRQTRNNSLKAPTIKQNKLSSQIVNPKSLINRNLKTNYSISATRGGIKRNSLSIQILNPRSLLKQNFNTISTKGISINGYNNKLGIRREFNSAIKIK